MHNGGDPVVDEDARERGLVEEIADDQGAPDEVAIAGGEIVVDDRLVAGRFKGATGVRADLAGAAGDENQGTIVHVINLRHVRLVSAGRLLLTTNKVRVDWW